MLRRIFTFCFLLYITFANPSVLIFDDYTINKPTSLDDQVTFEMNPSFLDPVITATDTSLPCAWHYDEATNSYLAYTSYYEYMNYYSSEGFYYETNSEVIPFVENQTTNNVGFNNNYDHCNYFLDAGQFRIRLISCPIDLTFNFVVHNSTVPTGWYGNQFIETFELSEQNPLHTVNIPTDFYYEINLEMIGDNHGESVIEFTGTKFVSHNPTIEFYNPVLDGDTAQLELVDTFVDTRTKKHLIDTLSPSNLLLEYDSKLAFIKVILCSSGTGNFNNNDDYIQFNYRMADFNMGAQYYDHSVIGTFDSHYYSNHSLPNNVLFLFNECTWEQNALFNSQDYIATQPYPATIISNPKVDRSNVYNCHSYAWYLPIGPSTDTDVNTWSENRSPRIWINSIDDGNEYLSQGLRQVSCWNTEVKVVVYIDQNGHALHSASVFEYNDDFYSSYLKSKWANGYLRKHLPQEVSNNYCNQGQIDVLFFGSIALTDNANDNDLLPLKNEIIDNYPNPFNPTTTISYTLNDNAIMPQLKIFNVKGQLVKKINLLAMAGKKKLQWSGENNDGGYVSSGMYFYSLLNDGKIVDTKKMVLMK